MEKPRRFNAYYFAFDQTNQEQVDKILSAICFAGKGYHHTDGWKKPTGDYGDHVGGSYEAWIQNAANEAAQRINQLESALRDMGEALEFYGCERSWTIDFHDYTDEKQDVFEQDEYAQTIRSDVDASRYGGKRAREALSRNKEILDTINKRGEE